jgi:hypothetical protein
MAKVVKCEACGKEFPNGIKATLHIRKKHPGKTVGTIVVEKEEKEKS